MSAIKKRLAEIMANVYESNVIYICVGKHLKPVDDKDKIIFHLDI